VREALNSALDEEMSADPSVFLMGEKVPPVTELVFFCSLLCFFWFNNFDFCGRLGSIKVHTRSVAFLRRFVFYLPVATELIYECY